MKRNLLFHALITLFLIGPSCVANAQTPDPGTLGPYAVTKAEYNLGDLAAVLDSFPNPVEVRGSVHYPTSLTGGPFPVIVLLHGRHSTCYRTTPSVGTTLAWPCPSTYPNPILSYAGYDYHAKQMASHGYIVISISANAINAADGSSNRNGMPGRGELVQYHLDLWNTWNTTGGGPFGSLFVGKLNLQRIGTMGHSRGGEGMVYHALLNKSLGSPYGIKAVLTLAPVDFYRKVLNDIPLMNIAPYCDGDVSNLAGVHFYDDARYNVVTDETPKHNVLMMGANHNYYNTSWTPGSYPAGGSDDWFSTTAAHCGTSSATSKRFDSTKQKAAYQAYAAAFFRTYVGGETQFLPILNAKDIIPPATSLLDTTNVYVSYHPGRTDRVDINRTDTLPTETVNNLAGNVTTNGLVSYGICGGGLTMVGCFTPTLTTTQESHRGTATVRGLAQMGMRWNDTADYYQNDIPAAYQDLRYVDRIQFRAASKYTEVATGQMLNFTVQLVDSAGDSSSLIVRDYSKALYYPPGSTTGTLPHVLFNTISLPVEDFTGINRAKVRKVKFKFNKSTAGSILISDLAFENDYCGRFDATFGYTKIGKNASFKDTLSVSTGDTLSWLWNFGNPASGTNDTSTLHNPTHLFTAPGTYTVCLSVKTKRLNGRVCTDTLCKTIVITTTDIQSMPDDNPINIYPNPAKDYLIIDNAGKTDILRLVNVYGQVVFTTSVTESHIQLPQNLATGIYYALVTSAKGTVYKKLFISQ
jgi:PKD repeat protein